MGLFSNVRNEILEEFASYCEITKLNRYDIAVNISCTRINRSLQSEINTPDANELIQMLEQKRWGLVPVCVYCSYEKCYPLERSGLYSCAKCRRHFNVFTNTILTNTKLPINKWYDLLAEMRANKNFTTHGFCKKIGITQKTCWLMARKIKTNPFAFETDVPILNILLTPFKFTYSTRPRIKPTWIEYKQECIISLSTNYYKNSPQYKFLQKIIALTEMHYECQIIKCAIAYNLNYMNLYRWLNGSRQLPHEKAIILYHNLNTYSVAKVA